VPERDGPVAVGGMYYLRAGTIGAAALSLLAAAVLVVNNLRDIDSDRHIGKMRCGVRFTLVLLHAPCVLVPALAWQEEQIGLVAPLVLRPWAGVSVFASGALRPESG
jgi:1,4-dihydroxy-2-naphthoate octaprenyltransferase